MAGAYIVIRVFRVCSVDNGVFLFFQTINILLTHACALISTSLGSLTIKFKVYLSKVDSFYKLQSTAAALTRPPAGARRGAAARGAGGRAPDGRRAGRRAPPAAPRPPPRPPRSPLVAAPLLPTIRLCVRNANVIFYMST